MTGPNALLARTLHVCCTRGGLYNMVHIGRRDPVGEKVGQPEYRRVMNDLRQQISDERLKVGEPIPSTVTLTGVYGVSSTVVRRAVSELTREGLLYGQPGKAVFVQAKPEDVHEEQLTLERLAKGLASLQTQVNTLEAPDSEALDDLRRELNELRSTVELLQSQLMDLFGRLGQPYPRDAHPPQSHPRRANGA
ncbi:winged helix-turn-helix domain-containing protein [Streptomyces sp. NPDC046994]|uniref:winged helix-turn-helix domain-containing protein n=1 Tax=Streptomyces sp. NPDC046994 TaxID=3155735 RepID=UPI003454083A